MSAWISVRVCTFTVPTNEFRLQVLILDTCAYFFSFFFCSCVCKTAHLCLRTRIGCTAIETLTLFLERVRPVSVLSTASVKYACLYRIYFSFGLGVIHRKVNPSLFSWGVITLPFVSSRTCEWKVSSFWLWKKNKQLQHLNVHVHRAVHEMLAYCVTSSLLQFDNDEFSFLMKNIYEYIHYIQSLKSIWTKRMSTWGCYFCCVCVFFVFFFSFCFSVLVHYRHVKCVYFLRKYWMYSKKKTRNPCWYQIFFFLRRFQKWKQNTQKKKSKSKDIFFIYTVEKRKKNPGMETVEHTASTILVVQTVTKNLKERTLSIPYWSFGCLQATWIFVGAVIFYFYDIFFSFLFPRETGGVCKRASAILDTKRCGFKDERQSQKHGGDPGAGRARVCRSWDLIKRTSGISVFFFSLFFLRRTELQGCRTLENQEREVTLLSARTLPLTHSPMHFCSFKLWGTILGMGAQFSTGGWLRLESRQKKKIPKPNWETGEAKPSPSSCT